MHIGVKWNYYEIILHDNYMQKPRALTIVLENAPCSDFKVNFDRISRVSNNPLHYIPLPLPPPKKISYLYFGIRLYGEFYPEEMYPTGSLLVHALRRDGHFLVLIVNIERLNLVEKATYGVSASQGSHLTKVSIKLTPIALCTRTCMLGKI